MHECNEGKVHGSKNVGFLEGSETVFAVMLF